MQTTGHDPRRMWRNIREWKKKSTVEWRPNDDYLSRINIKISLLKGEPQ